MHQGNTTSRITISGNTIEEYEQNVYAKLRETIEANKSYMDNIELFSSDEMSNPTCNGRGNPKETAIIKRLSMTKKRAEDALRCFEELAQTLSIAVEDNHQQVQTLSVSAKDSKQKPQTSSVAETVSSQSKFDWDSFENQEFSCERLFKNLEAK